MCYSRDESADAALEFRIAASAEVASTRKGATIASLLVRVHAVIFYTIPLGDLFMSPRGKAALMNLYTPSCDTESMQTW